MRLNKYFKHQQNYDNYKYLIFFIIVFSIEIVKNNLLRIFKILALNIISKFQKFQPHVT